MVNKFKTLGKTKVIKGSVANPESNGLAFVLVDVNMAGETKETEILKVLDKKWPKARIESKSWHNTRTGMDILGSIKQIPVQSDVWLTLMICKDKDQKIDMAGLEKCLKNVCKQALYDRASVHVSSVLTEQCSTLPELCKQFLVEEGVSVIFYDESK